MRRFLKLISSTLIFCLVYSDISYAALDGASANPPTRPLHLLSQDPTRFEAPLDFCSLKEIHRSPSTLHPQPFIIHIQDAHSNFSGQENLAKTLDQLITKYNVSLVLVEGGPPVDGSLDLLKNLTTPKETKRIARSLLLEGKISGEEYLNLTSNHPMKIMGVEDMSLYVQSIQAYASLTDKRQAILDYLKTIQHSLNKLKTKLYPKELLEYERGMENAMPGGRQGKLKMEEKDKIENLLLLVKQTNLSLANYPSLQKLQDLKNQEKTIDFNLANLEQAALIQELEGKGKREKGKGILQHISQARNSKTSSATKTADPSFGGQNIIDLSKQNNISLQKYQSFLQYTNYLQSFQELDLEQVLEESKQAEEEAYRRAMENRKLKMEKDDQNKPLSKMTLAKGQPLQSSTLNLPSSIHDPLLLRAIDRYIHLLYTAYSIQMTTQDFKSFELNEPDFSTIGYLAFLNRKLSEQGYFQDMIPYKDLLEEGKEALHAFYQSVNQRDLAFLKNMKEIMENGKLKMEKKDKTPSKMLLAKGELLQSSIFNFPFSISQQPKVVVLITGGYHTQHLTQLFKQENYSYAVLSPHVTQETNQRKYEEALLGPFREEKRTIQTIQGESYRNPSLLIKKPNDDIRRAMALFLLPTPQGIINYFRTPENGKQIDQCLILAAARLAKVALPSVESPKLKVQSQPLLNSSFQNGARMAETPGKREKVKGKRKTKNPTPARLAVTANGGNSAEGGRLSAVSPSSTIHPPPSAVGARMAIQQPSDNEPYVDLSTVLGTKEDLLASMGSWGEPLAPADLTSFNQRLTYTKERDFLIGSPDPQRRSGGYAVKDVHEGASAVLISPQKNEALSTFAIRSCMGVCMKSVQAETKAGGVNEALFLSHVSGSLTTEYKPYLSFENFTSKQHDDIFALFFVRNSKRISSEFISKLFRNDKHPTILILDITEEVNVDVVMSVDGVLLKVSQTLDPYNLLETVFIRWEDFGQTISSHYFKANKGSPSPAGTRLADSLQNTNPPAAARLAGDHDIFFDDSGGRFNLAAPQRRLSRLEVTAYEGERAQAQLPTRFMVRGGVFDVMGPDGFVDLSGVLDIDVLKASSEPAPSGESNDFSSWIHAAAEALNRELYATGLIQISENELTYSGGRRLHLDVSIRWFQGVPWNWLEPFTYAHEAAYELVYNENCYYLLSLDGQRQPLTDLSDRSDGTFIQTVLHTYRKLERWFGPRVGQFSDDASRFLNRIGKFSNIELRLGGNGVAQLREEIWSSHRLEALRDYLALLWDVRESLFSEISRRFYGEAANTDLFPLKKWNEFFYWTNPLLSLLWPIIEYRIQREIEVGMRDGNNDLLERIRQMFRENTPVTESYHPPDSGLPDTVKVGARMAETPGKREKVKGKRKTKNPTPARLAETANGGNSAEGGRLSAVSPSSTIYPPPSAVGARMAKVDDLEVSLTELPPDSKDLWLRVDDSTPMGCLANVLKLDKTKRIRDFLHSESGLYVHEIEVENFNGKSFVPQGASMLRELFNYKNSDDETDWTALHGQSVRFFILTLDTGQWVGIFPVPIKSSDNPAKKTPRDDPWEDSQYRYLDLTAYLTPYKVLRHVGLPDTLEEWRKNAEKIKAYSEKLKKFLEHYKSLLREQGEPNFILPVSQSAHPFIYAEFDRKEKKLFAAGFHPVAWSNEEWLDGTPKERVGQMLVQTEHPRAVFVRFPGVYNFSQAVDSDAAFIAQVYDRVQNLTSNFIEEKASVGDLGTGTGLIAWIVSLALEKKARSVSYRVADVNPFAIASAEVNLRHILDLPLAEATVNDNLISPEGQKAFSQPVSILTINAPAGNYSKGTNEAIPAVGFVAMHDGGKNGHRFWRRWIEGVSDVIDPQGAIAIVWNNGIGSQDGAMEAILKVRDLSELTVSIDLEQQRVTYVLLFDRAGLAAKSNFVENTLDTLANAHRAELQKMTDKEIQLFQTLVTGISDLFKQWALDETAKPAGEASSITTSFLSMIRKAVDWYVESISEKTEGGQPRSLLELSDVVYCEQDFKTAAGFFKMIVETKQFDRNSFDRATYLSREGHQALIGSLCDFFSNLTTDDIRDADLSKTLNRAYSEFQNAVDGLSRLHEAMRERIRLSSFPLLGARLAKVENVNPYASPGTSSVQDPLYVMMLKRRLKAPAVLFWVSTALMGAAFFLCFGVMALEIHTPVKKAAYLRHLLPFSAYLLTVGWYLYGTIGIFLQSIAFGAVRKHFESRDTYESSGLGPTPKNAAFLQEIFKEMADKYFSLKSSVLIFLFPWMLYTNLKAAVNLYAHKILEGPQSVGVSGGDVQKMGARLSMDRQLRSSNLKRTKEINLDGVAGARLAPKSAGSEPKKLYFKSEHFPNVARLVGKTPGGVLLREQREPSGRRTLSSGQDRDFFGSVRDHYPRGKKFVLQQGSDSPFLGDPSSISRTPWSTPDFSRTNLYQSFFIFLYISLCIAFPVAAQVSLREIKRLIESMQEKRSFFNFSLEHQVSMRKPMGRIVADNGMPSSVQKDLNLDAKGQNKPAVTDVLMSASDVLGEIGQEVNVSDGHKANISNRAPRVNEELSISAARMAKGSSTASKRRLRSEPDEQTAKENQVLKDFFDSCTGEGVVLVMDEVLGNDENKIIEDRRKFEYGMATKWKSIIGQAQKEGGVSQEILKSLDGFGQATTESDALYERRLSWYIQGMVDQRLLVKRRVGESGLEFYVVSPIGVQLNGKARDLTPINRLAVEDLVVIVRDRMRRANAPLYPDVMDKVENILKNIDERKFLRKVCEALVLLARDVSSSFDYKDIVIAPNAIEAEGILINRKALSEKNMTHPPSWAGKTKVYLALINYNPKARNVANKTQTFDEKVGLFLDRNTRIFNSHSLNKPFSGGINKDVLRALLLKDLMDAGSQKILDSAALATDRDEHEKAKQMAAILNVLPYRSSRSVPATPFAIRDILREYQNSSGLTISRNVLLGLLEYLHKMNLVDDSNGILRGDGRGSGKGGRAKLRGMPATAYYRTREGVISVEAMLEKLKTPQSSKKARFVGARLAKAALSPVENQKLVQNQPKPEEAGMANLLDTGRGRMNEHQRFVGGMRRPFRPTYLRTSEVRSVSGSERALLLSLATSLSSERKSLGGGAPTEVYVSNGPISQKRIATVLEVVPITRENLHLLDPNLFSNPAQYVAGQYLVMRNLATPPVSGAEHKIYYPFTADEMTSAKSRLASIDTVSRLSTQLSQTRAFTNNLTLTEFLATTLPSLMEIGKAHEAFQKAGLIQSGRSLTFAIRAPENKALRESLRALIERVVPQLTDAAISVVFVDEGIFDPQGKLLISNDGTSGLILAGSNLVVVADASSIYSRGVLSGKAGLLSAQDMAQEGKDTYSMANYVLLCALRALFSGVPEDRLDEAVALQQDTLNQISSRIFNTPPSLADWQRFIRISVHYQSQSDDGAFFAKYTAKHLGSLTAEILSRANQAIARSILSAA